MDVDSVNTIFDYHLNITTMDAVQILERALRRGVRLSFNNKTIVGFAPKSINIYGRIIVLFEGDEKTIRIQSGEIELG